MILCNVIILCQNCITKLDFFLACKQSNVAVCLLLNSRVNNQAEENS